ncbi:DUF1643 domain-containing protein [Mesobacillus jeotgali]|uniref:DUF1643 domain-containing protein n=1 Tax=Mesobacillus jeotgali TaxID=129985 RepID=UPI0009A7D430|nr:DUF1643 domain-containing protein [Mesobacillus jeotgali]
MSRYIADYILGEPHCEKETIVNTKQNFIEKRDFLNIELNKQGYKTITIVMMNPSKADSRQSDNTINKLIEFFISHSIHSVDNGLKTIKDIKYLQILNLLPIYNPNSRAIYSDINTIIAEIGTEKLFSVLESNQKKIKEVLQDSHYIVIAWGMPENFSLPLYFEQAAMVLRTLEASGKNVYVFKMKSLKGSEYYLTKHLNPPHPSKGIILSLVRVDVNSHYRIIPRL